MQRTTEHIVLPVPAAGTRRQLTVYRYSGASGGPKAYFHTALHADEWPGLLVLQHLIALLDSQAAAGNIRGEIVIVPFANPIGLAQQLNFHWPGRYDFGGSGNFNRNFPDLTPPVLAMLRDRLGDAGNGAATIERVRQTLRQVTASLASPSAPQREVDALKATLLALAADADFVFDLHCDSEALMHLYAPNYHRALAEQLGAELNAAVLLLEDNPGGGAFDDTCARVWWQLNDALGLSDDDPRALPPACFATTVELRGRADVDDTLAAQDARALLRFLVRQGVVAGEPEATPGGSMLVAALGAVDVVRSPCAGLVAYRKGLGEQVEQGETIADIVSLDAEPSQARTPVVAATSGLVFARLTDKMVRPGDAIAKIAGRQPLAYRTAGAMLSD